MQAVMNLKIKFRESFRPFAPSAMREHVADWFELDGDSPYMLLVAGVAPKRRRAMTAEEERLWGIEKLNVVRSDIPIATVPRPMISSGDLDFSFSGLKTSVLTRVRSMEAIGNDTRADLAASFQEAIVDVLVAKCMQALDAEALQRLVVAGGVGANARLRARLTQAAGERGARVYFPPLKLCTDNGAMIAFAAALKYPQAPRGAAGYAIHPRWDLAQAARETP
jgi:tRNA A37 threonylcarbamoyltransferase TsaD